MIEINLLPGGQRKKKRAAGPGFSLKLPAAMPALDRLTLFVVAAWIIGPALLAWMFLGVQGQRNDLDVALNQAAADSARYARLIESQRTLTARRDTIAQKLAIIQEIDAGRYIWPHILDEVSRAMPEYTWLRAIDQIGAGGPTPTFQVEGRTGSLPALTRFMRALESSPFIRNVQLVSSEQAQLGGDATRIVNNFVLTGTYMPPAPEAVVTVPLFEDETNDTTALGEEANDGAGTS